MAWTQAQLDHARKLLATGAKEVRFDGPNGHRQQKNYSPSELRSLIREMENELTPNTRRTLFTAARHSKDT